MFFQSVIWIHESCCRMLALFNIAQPLVFLTDYPSPSAEILETVWNNLDRLPHQTEMMIWIFNLLIYLSYFF